MNVTGEKQQQKQNQEIFLALAIIINLGNINMKLTKIFDKSFFR